MKASCIVVGDFAAVYPAGEVRHEFTAVTAVERAEVAVARGVGHGRAAFVGEWLRWGMVER